MCDITGISIDSILLLSLSFVVSIFVSLLVCFFCFCFCSRWSFVDVPLIFFCPADHVPDWQPRILLGTVEARSVKVKKTIVPRHPHSPLFFIIVYYLLVVLRYRTLRANLTLVTNGKTFGRAVL